MLFISNGPWLQLSTNFDLKLSENKILFLDKYIKSFNVLSYAAKCLQCVHPSAVNYSRGWSNPRDLYFNPSRDSVLLDTHVI